MTRLRHWAGNAVVSLGAIAVFLTAVGIIGAIVVVFGAAGRLLIQWAEYYPK